MCVGCGRDHHHSEKGERGAKHDPSVLRGRLERPGKQIVRKPEAKRQGGAQRLACGLTRRAAAPYPAPTAIESVTDGIMSTEAVLRDLAKHAATNGETVQNFDGFGKAFGCTKGQPMYPANSCRVW